MNTKCSSFVASRRRNIKITPNGDKMLILRRSTSLTICVCHVFLPPTLRLSARGFGTSRKRQPLGKVHLLAIGKFSES